MDPIAAFLGIGLVTCAVLLGFALRQQVDTPALQGRVPHLRRLALAAAILGSIAIVTAVIRSL